MPPDLEIAPMRPDQWGELRALRLEMLADSPKLVAAQRDSSRWVGTMSAYVDPGPGRTYVVDPSTREREMVRPL